MGLKAGGVKLAASGVQARWITFAAPAAGRAAATPA